jgi:hypothetical protein
LADINDNNSEQHFFIPVDAELDLSQDDALIPLSSPKLHFNDQQAESGLLANSFTYEELGYIAGRSLYRFRTYIDGKATTTYIDPYGYSGRVTRTGKTIQVLDDDDNVVVSFIYNTDSVVRDGNLYNAWPISLYSDQKWYYFIDLFAVCVDEYGQKVLSENAELYVDMKTLAIRSDSVKPAGYDISVEWENSEFMKVLVKKQATGTDTLTFRPPDIVAPYTVLNAERRYSYTTPASQTAHYPLRDFLFYFTGYDLPYNQVRMTQVSSASYSTIDTFNVRGLQMTSQTNITGRYYASAAYVKATDTSTLDFEFGAGELRPYKYVSVQSSVDGTFENWFAATSLPLVLYTQVSSVSTTLYNCIGVVTENEIYPFSFIFGLGVAYSGGTLPLVFMRVRFSVTPLHLLIFEYTTACEIDSAYKTQYTIDSWKCSVTGEWNAADSTYVVSADAQIKFHNLPSDLSLRKYINLKMNAELRIKCLSYYDFASFYISPRIVRTADVWNVIETNITPVAVPAPQIGTPTTALEQTATATLAYQDGSQASVKVVFPSRSDLVAVKSGWSQSVTSTSSGFHLAFGATPLASVAWQCKDKNAITAKLNFIDNTERLCVFSLPVLSGAGGVASTVIDRTYNQDPWSLDVDYNHWRLRMRNTFDPAKPWYADLINGPSGWTFTAQTWYAYDYESQYSASLAPADFGHEYNSNKYNLAQRVIFDASLGLKGMQDTWDDYSPKLRSHSTSGTEETFTWTDAYSPSFSPAYYTVVVDMAADLRCVCDVTDVLQDKGMITVEDGGFNDVLMLEEPLNIYNGLINYDEKADGLKYGRRVEDHRYYAVNQRRCLEGTNQDIRLVGIAGGLNQYIASRSIDDIFALDGRKQLVQWGVSSNVSMTEVPMLWGVWVDLDLTDLFIVRYTPAVNGSIGTSNLNYPKAAKWSFVISASGIPITINGAPALNRLTYYGAEVTAYDIMARAVITATWANNMFMMGIKFSRGINQWTLRGSTVVHGFGSVGPTGIITGNFLPSQSCRSQTGFYLEPEKDIVNFPPAIGVNRCYLVGGELLFYNSSIVNYCYGLDTGGNVMLVPLSSQMQVARRSKGDEQENNGFLISWGAGRLTGIWGYEALMHWATTWLTGARDGEQVYYELVETSKSVTMKPDELIDGLISLAGAALDIGFDEVIYAAKKEIDNITGVDSSPEITAQIEQLKQDYAITDKNGDQHVSWLTDAAAYAMVRKPQGMPLRWGDFTQQTVRGSKQMQLNLKVEMAVMNDHVPRCFPTQSVYSIPGGFNVQLVRTARQQISYQWMKSAVANGAAVNKTFVALKTAATIAGAIPGIMTMFAASGVGVFPAQIATALSNLADSVPPVNVKDYGNVIRTDALEVDIQYGGNQHLYMSGPYGKKHGVVFDEARQNINVREYGEKLGPGGIGSPTAKRLEIKPEVIKNRTVINIDGGVIIGSETMAGKDGLVRTGAPVFSAPGLYESLVEPVYKVWVAASGDDIIHVSIDDTKVIDGPFTNIVIDRETIFVASTYNVVSAVRGGNVNLFKPQALTDGLRLNKTGNNYIEGANWVHAFDGYANRIASWVGAGGGDVELLQQVSQYLPNKLKRTLHTVFPPTTYFGAFSAPPPILYNHRVNVEMISTENKQRWVEPGTKEDTAVTRLSFPVFYRRVSNLPAGIQTIGTYKLYVVNGLTSLTTDVRTSSIRDITTAKDVMIYGRTYRGFNEYLSAVNQQYGIMALSNVAVITGYKILGADTKSILMFNTASGQMALFKGAEILEKAYKVRRVNDFDEAVYEFIQQELLATGTLNAPEGQRVIIRFDEMKAKGMVPYPREDLAVQDTYAGAVGFVMQGRTRATVHFPLYHTNMDTFTDNTIASHRGQWVKVKGDTLADFFSSRIYYQGQKDYYWQPFRLATAFHGLDDSVDCLFEYVLTFAITEWMYSIIGDKYVTVYLAAEMAALGGRMESEVTRLRLRADMFNRKSGRIGYYSYRYNARLGAGNRERLFIWSDDIISLRPIEVIARPITTARTSPLLTAPDFSGTEAF